MALTDEKTYSDQALPAFFHAGQQLHGARAIEQEILVHHEKRAHVQRVLHVLHDFEELVSGFVKVDALALAAEERRRGAEVAAHGASNRGNDGGCGVARVVGQAHAQHPHAEAGEDFGMLDGRTWVFAEIAAHPRDAFAAHDVVGINQLVEAGNGGDMSADDDGGLGRQAAHAAAHLAHLAEIRDDAGDADNVVFGRSQFALEALQGREVEQRAGGGDVALDHHQAPGAMEHAQRKAALLARDLVVIKLHGIDGAAAEFVVARVRAEDRAQQHARVSAFGMRRNRIKVRCRNHESIVGDRRAKLL